MLVHLRTTVKMKFLILLSLAALSSANILYGVKKDLKVDTDRIVIHTPLRTIVIEKSRDGTRGVQVCVLDQNQIIKKIKVDSNKRFVEEDVLCEEVGRIFKVPEMKLSDREMKTSSFEDETLRSKKPDSQNVEVDSPQMTILIKIFKKYEGVIRRDTFKELMKEIRQAVTDRKLNPLIGDILQELEVENSVITPTADLWKLTGARQGEVFGRRDDIFLQTRDQRNMEMGRRMDIEEETKLSRESQRARDRNQFQRFDNDVLEADDLLRLTQRFSDEDELKQLTCRKDIREIQGQILQLQLRAQQLQLRQPFLNQRKEQIKLQLLMGQRQGLSLMQMKELIHARELLRMQEQKLLELEMDLLRKIEELQVELIRREEELQQFLEDEKRRDERFIVKMS